MKITELLADKGLKAKEKVDSLSKLLLDSSIAVHELIAFAATTKKDADKGTCVEALEFATRQNISLASLEMLQLVSQTLTEKAPRVKWESAKVIANIAHRFPENLDDAIRNLLTNTEHEGTVVRWSAATALSEILKLKTNHFLELLPTCEAICNREESASIQKIYRAAIKKVTKG